MTYSQLISEVSSRVSGTFSVEVNTWVRGGEVGEVEWAIYIVSGVGSDAKCRSFRGHTAEAALAALLASLPAADADPALDAVDAHEVAANG